MVPMIRRARAWALSGLRVCLALLPTATGLSFAQSPAIRIVQPVDDTRVVSLPGNVHPFAIHPYDKGQADTATPTGRIQLVFKRSAAQQLALRQYLADLQNPHAASYHKWLTPAAYGAAFGISDPDLATVEQWLQGHGFKIESVSPARNLLEFSGTLGQVESTFHTSIHTLSVNGQTHLANISNPSIPAALLPVIAAVGPLNDFHPVSHAKLGASGHFDPASRTVKPDLTLFSSSGTPYLYVDPADAATIYDTPNAAMNPAYKGTSYDGTGISIGIAGDSNITLQDVTNYRLAFLGETSANANVPTVVVDGTDPGINGDEVEALLDTEVAGGLAPKAKLYLYTAADTDLQSGLFLAIFRAIDDNTVSILNISFGGCEAGLGAAGNQLVSEVMAQAAAQGISVTVSSGDSGSAGCDSDAAKTAQNGLAVNGLASSPYTIAVGGTDYPALLDNFSTYVQDASAGQQYSGTAPYYRTALSYIPESPWNDSTYPNTDIASNNPLSLGGSTDIIGGGGGASNCAQSTSDASGNITCQAGYPKPAFQSSLTPADSVRDLPDVAFLAGNGLYSAVWAVCADNVALGRDIPVFTDCQTSNGQLTSSTSVSGVGGTSAAAPAFAGMLALVEQKTGSRLGQADYILYQLAQSKYASVFHDVTVGDNSVVCASGSPDCGANGFLTGYDATTGYDQASGLGSVDAAQMVNNWSSVSLAATSTTFNINGSTAPINVTHGTSLTFNVGVTPSTATGNVSIVDNANQNPGGTLNNGQLGIPLTSGNGTATYNGLPGGTYTVSAMYGGDTSDASSTSNGITVTISPEDSTTGLTVSAYAADGTALANLASVSYGSYILQDAQIYGKAEGQNTQGIATGTVKFLDNGTQLGSASISAADQAFLENPTSSFASLPVGTHSLTASYAGDSSFGASTSAAVPVTIVKAATSVVLQLASSSISSLQSDQLNVFVSASSVGAAPTGTITLSDNGATIATLTVSNGLATTTLTGSSLPAGKNALTTVYSGDANYAGSSASATITVAEAGFNLSNSGSITFAAGATTGNTAAIKVSPSNGFLGVVNLSCAVTAPSGASSPATCTVPSSVDITGSPAVSATLSVASTSTTSAGAYTVTVTGTDATTGKMSASTSVAVTITGGATAPGTFSLANGGNITVAPGATTGNTSQITVTPANGFTGQVNLTCALSTAVANGTAPPTCNVPASVTISGTTAATATLTVTTTAGTAAHNQANPLKLGATGGLVFAGLLLVVLPRRRKIWYGLTLILAVIAFGAVGCGSSHTSTSTGSGSSGTTAGTYTVTVTGTDAATGKVSAQTAVTLTVN